jgi:GDPmannose 4,6-dehydratase
MRALITGISGQDGSYLAELLLEKGYEVHGVLRRHSYAPGQTARIEHLRDRVSLHYGDLTDSLGIVQLLSAIQPDEVYNLAAQSHVAVSFDVPEYTGQVDALGTLRLLESVRAAAARGEWWAKVVRVYQASTSELFGSSPPPQDELTPFRPQSPYACAKLYAHEVAGVYRRAHGLHVCRGILFNHESPRRGETFVTRKVTMAVAALAMGRAKGPLVLGNLDALRDWGHAADYVDAMWRMLQQPEPCDLVVATGESHSVRDLVHEAFGIVGLSLREDGAGMVVSGVDLRRMRTLGMPTNRLPEIGRRVVESGSPGHVRPAEVDHLRGDSSRARDLLGWAPTRTFWQLVEEMVTADLRRVFAGSLLS